MRLLKRPDTVTETNIFQNQQYTGLTTISDVEIICPDDDTDYAKVWNTLKYGILPDLANAMHSTQKIPKIAFPDDNIILHGVFVVMEMGRTSGWEGRVFKCTIDHYEIIP